MSDQGSGPTHPPEDDRSPFSREGAAGQTPPGAPDPRSSGGPGGQPPEAPPGVWGAGGPASPPSGPPPFPPEAATQPEPPYGPAAAPYGPPTYGQPGSYGDPGYGQAGYGVPAYPADPYLPAGYGGYGYGGGPVDHPRATPALVTGIIGLVLSFVCGVGGLTGIAGVVLGTKAKREIDADPARWTGRSKANAGVVTGAVGLFIMVLWVVLFSVVGISGS